MSTRVLFTDMDGTLLNDAKEVTGVLVVCEGGDDKNLVAYITDAINGLLGVPVHKIKVMKMSE